MGQVKSLFRLSKDPGPKKHPHAWEKEESKEPKDFMEVEERGVLYNKYNGRCTKQYVKM